MHTFACLFEANHRVSIVSGKVIVGLALNTETLVEECFARCRTWSPLAASLSVVNIELKFVFSVFKSIKLRIMRFGGVWLHLKTPMCKVNGFHGIDCMLEERK